MKSKLVYFALGLLLSAVAAPAEVWRTNLPCFLGGAYDGWDRSAITNTQWLGDAHITLSSGTNQTFDWNTNPSLATLTIFAEDPQGTITNGGTLRVGVPAAWACRFDTNAAVSYSGNAAGKVSPASYAGDGRTLTIPVTAAFTNGDTLTVAGLKLADLRLVHADDPRQLELDFTGDGARDASDLCTLLVRVPWAGGAYDGWDYCVAPAYRKIWVPRGTVITLYGR